MSHLVKNPLNFIKAGKSLFTVVNEKTGNRFTYKVVRSKDNPIWFVKVLNGSNNDSNYLYIGAIKENSFGLTKNSKVKPDAKSFKVFDWIWHHATSLPENIKFYHEGRCGRCGRTLTVPESIESGFGPECINHV